MTRGRKSNPKSLHALRGNPSRLKLNAPDSPAFDIEIPPPPDTLDGYGRREWERVTRLMYELKIITSLDEAIVEAYCQNRSELRILRQELKGQKRFFKSERSGMEHPNPRMREIRRLVQEQRLIVQELGFSPTSRSKVSTTGTNGKAKTQKQNLAESLFRTTVKVKSTK